MYFFVRILVKIDLYVLLILLTYHLFPGSGWGRCFNKGTEQESLERAEAIVSCQVDRCKPVCDNVSSNSCKRVHPNEVWIRHTYSVDEAPQQVSYFKKQGVQLGIDGPPHLYMNIIQFQLRKPRQTTLRNWLQTAFLVITKVSTLNYQQWIQIMMIKFSALYCIITSSHAVTII